MGESIKATCCLVLIVACIAAAFAWGDDRPSDVTWMFRIGMPLLAFLAVGVLFYFHFRMDLEHDYLKDIHPAYFNRDGFCFLITADKEDGIAYILAYFQNQRDQPCVGRIALRPVHKLFRGRAKLDWIMIEIACEPAAFGWARVAIPVPKEVQGTKQKLEVGASVEYPHGKGRTLRFRDGIFIRSNADFGDSFGTALTYAAAAGGAIVITKPATATLELPTGVAERIPNNRPPEVKTLWKLGDLPLAAAMQ